MKQYLTILLLLATTALASPDPRAILHQALNRLRGPAMTATYTLVVERPDRSKTYELRVVSDGDRKALIRVILPKRDAGQAFLTIGDDIWVYNPRLGRVLRLPPSGHNSRFLGSDVSYADLSGRDLEDNYQPQTRDVNEDAILLELTPKPHAPTPWGKVTLAVEKKRVLPQKIVYYDQRGNPVKEVVISGFAEYAPGRYLITTSKVRDLLNQGWRTRFEVSDWRVGPVPDGCFAQSALKRGCRY